MQIIHTNTYIFGDEIIGSNLGSKIALHIKSFTFNSIYQQSSGSENNRRMGSDTHLKLFVLHQLVAPPKKKRPGFAIQSKSELRLESKSLVTHI